MAYKLTYFDIPGRGEPIRYIFAAAGVKFTDNRIKFADWPAIKESLGGAQLPILEVGDKKVTQSLTICRYLGRKFKLAGADAWEAAKCDEMVDANGDVVEAYVNFVFKEQNPERKEEKKNTFVKDTLPTYLGKVNKILMENEGSVWLIGKNMTWADIVIVVYLGQMLENSGADPSIVNGYPYVRKLQEAVYSNQQIKEYRGKQ